MILRIETFLLLIFAILLGAKGTEIEPGDKKVDFFKDKNGDYQLTLEENLKDLVLARFVSDSEPKIPDGCPYKYKWEKNKDGKYDFYLTEPLDYEKQIRYKCVIDGLNTYVILINTNDEPPILTPSPCFIDENTTFTMSNAPCKFIVQDADKMYKDTTVILSNEDKDVFTIKFNDTDNWETKDTAWIYMFPNDLLDYEQKNIYVLDVEINDGVNKNTATLIINVNDLPDTEPKFINLKNVYSINEEKPFSFTVRAIDGDYQINSKITYEVVQPDIIKIDKTSGEVSIPAIDRDKNEYPNDVITLKIRATEVKEPNMSADVDITINILDINDNPPKIKKVNGEDPGEDRKFEMKLDENSKAIEFEIEIQDIDSITYNQFSVDLVDTKNKGQLPFQILPNIGHDDSKFQLSITNSSKLDYEDPNWKVIEFDIKTIDLNKDSFFDALHVTIDLNNLDDEAPEFDDWPKSITVDETIGKDQKIFQVKTHDPDNLPDEKTIYSISGYDSLTINKDTGLITTKVEKAFDFQKSQKVEVEVTATDKAKNSNRATLTINVRDINNLSPEIQTTTEPIKLSENQKPDVEIKGSTIKAFDMDSTCSLKARIDWENTKFQKNFADIKVKEEYFFLNVSQKDVENSPYPCYIEMQFKTNKNANPKEGDGGIPDYEIFDIVNLVLAVNDTKTEAGASETKVILQIHITDVNDEAPYFTIKELKRTIWESITVGKIETIVAQDKDTNDNVTYTLIPKNKDANNHKDWIVIGKYSGDLSIGDGVQIDCDTEKITELEYECEAKDLKDHKATIPVKIEIQDTNNKWPKFTLKDKYEIKETKKDYLLVDIKPKDDDRDAPNNEVQCQFNALSRDCANYFLINEDNQIKSSKENEIHFKEGDNQMQCTIKCHDYGSPQLSSNDSTFTVIVIDINDHDPHFESATKFTIYESVKKDGVVQRLVASDADSDIRAELEFEIVDHDKDQLFDLKIVDTKQVDLIAKKDLRGFYGEKKITVKITDCKRCTEEEDKRRSITQELTITINKHNFDQPEIVFPKENGIYTLSNTQTAGEPLNLFNSVDKLPDFQGHNEKDKCTKKWNTDFSFAISKDDPDPHPEYFKIIQKPDSCSATLTVTDAYVKNNIENLQVDFEITYEITDPETKPDDPIKEEPRKTVLKTVTFKFLNPGADPFFDKNTKTIEFIEEHVDDEPIKIDPAHYPFQNTLAIHYKVIQDENYFNYSVDDSTIYLLEALDYETQKQHVFKLQASKDGNKPSTDQSILTVTVNVKDINDCPPIFEKTTFIGGLMSGQKTSDPVILQATDADDVSQGTLTYAVSNFKKSGESLDKITEKDFSLTGIEGNQLKATFEVDTSMKGYFQFTANVSDAKDELGYGPLSSEANVKIFIITSDNTVDLKFENSLTEVEKQKDCMLNNITEVLGYETSKYAIIQDKNSDEEITTATLYFVDTENYELLTKSDVMKKLSNIKTFRSLRDELRKCDNLVLQSFDSESKTDEDLTAILKAWLIGVTVVLGTLCVIMIIIFFLKTRQLKNRISNLTTTKFGSQESGLNRIHVPTTNVNAVEGANAIFNTKMEDYDYTRHSTLSGESDLVGVEDNPEFDMDFDPNITDNNYI